MSPPIHRSPLMPGHRAPKANVLNKTGERIGKLVAVEFLERDHVFNRHLYRFLCDCGATKVSSFHNVRMTKHRSCGGCIPPLQKQHTTIGK